MRRTPLFMAGLVAVAATLRLSAPAQADLGLFVSFPAKTFVNTANGYSITVSDPDGPGTLESRWADGTSTFVQSIPHDGAVSLTLHDGVGTFAIFRCDGATCVDTGVSSPTLNVYSAITLDGEVTGPSSSHE